MGQRSVRNITHAHFFDIICTRPPQVAAADDAAAAEWVPVASLRKVEEELFEDHFHILNHFLGVCD
jgi:bifunctional NMN adenylyltransferase/nudix hydrolase